MVRDTPSRKASSDMPEPDQPKMPTYEYQRDDNRSFTVGYEAPPRPHDADRGVGCENKAATVVLKVV